MVKVGSDIGIDVEHIGIDVLELDYGFQLVLDNFFLCTFILKEFNFPFST